MAHSNINPADVTILPTGFKAFIHRRFQEILGLGLLAILAAITLSLATWSITDPSFNHAVNLPVKNYLGKIGAIIADLGMQSFGIGTIILLLPPIIWTFLFIRHTPLSKRILRLMTWPISAIFISGFLSALPAPISWPLPTGLGGIFGDAFLSMVVWGFAVFLNSPGLAQFCSAIALIIPGAWLLIYSANIKFNNAGPGIVESGADAAVRSIGAFAHIRLSIGAFFKRCALKIGHFILGLLWPFGRATRQAPNKITSWGYNVLSHGVSALFHRKRTDSSERIEPYFEVGAQSISQQEMFDDAPEDMELPSNVARIGSAPHDIKQAASRRRLKRAKNYKPPALTLLAAAKARGANPELAPKVLKQNAAALENVLDDFGIRGTVINVRPGPVVTLYELEPAPGIKSSRVIGLADDIARSMSAISARVAVVPGRNVIGIELPNSIRETVYLRELLASQAFSEISSGLPLALGKNIGGEAIMADLTRMPHLLIAGTTGSGKSVGINTMILSLLYRMPPDRCKLIMIDPKMLELSVYEGIPHLLAPVVTDPKKAVVALKWTVREMEDRYKMMSKIGVRNIDGFNERVALAKANGEIITRTVQTGFDQGTGQPIYEQQEMDLEVMPYIVVIVDEMADLMMVAGKDIEGTIQRLAQMARAAGIHMITATQRPSVDVITGTIKANFPTRISFQVTSKIDSRTILGEQGAEQLLGQGDMLYMAGGGRISRIHGPFVSDIEVENIVKYLKKQGTPEYLEAVTLEDENSDSSDMLMQGQSSGDELYDQAVAIVARDKKASTSYIQRRLSIGYNRAATLIERMEEQGVISSANHAGKREVLIGEPGEGVQA